MSSWCRRCGEYDVWGKGCRCELLGRAWRPESGETEEDARELWGYRGSLEAAVKTWAAHLDSQNCYECFEAEQTIVVRTKEGQREYFCITRESEPVYYVREACDTDRAEARRQQARTLRSQRKYAQQRREYLASKSAT